uniref:UDP-glycosyltransferases domain-containing protein n=1 Tax=Oryza brachyantha TaxID=4533 RepID=J3MN32_ORYBR
MGFAVHVAREMGIPGYLFFTPSACGLLAYLNFDQLVKRGYVPFKDESCFTNGYLDTRLDWVAGMIAGVRLRDFPTFIRTTDADDVMVTINIKQSELDAPAADGILLNTFDDLERAALDAILARLPNTFTVGPLGPEVSPASYLPSLTSSLWKGADRGAAGLAGHADGAVLYVNFGSITVMTREQIGEFARGLAAAGSPFLWVVRPDMVTNCRYACEEWGVGVEMAREAGRREVEAAVKELMGGGERAAAMRRRASEWKEKAAAAVAPGGSSQRNLESFVAEIARVKR